MNYRKITSRSNTKIQELLAIKQRKTGGRQRVFLIEGPHLIEMALASETLIENVFFTDSFLRKKEGLELVNRLSGRASGLFEVTSEVFQKITETETPQGIIAAASRRIAALEELRLKKIPLLAVSDGIQDPGNLGTIIRSADAADASAVVILPGSCEVYMQKTVRATAGSIFNIPVIHSRVEELLEWLRSHKISLVVTAADAKKTVFDSDLNNPLALVFGNEAQGVQTTLRKAADMVLSVPILGKAESLNVATSATVCLYEAVRQRSFENKSGI